MGHLEKRQLHGASVYPGERRYHEPISVYVETDRFGIRRMTDKTALVSALYPTDAFYEWSTYPDRRVDLIQDIALVCLDDPNMLIRLHEHVEERKKSKDPIIYPERQIGVFFDDVDEQIMAELSQERCDRLIQSPYHFAIWMDYLSNRQVIERLSSGAGRNSADYRNTNLIGKIITRLYDSTIHHSSEETPVGSRGILVVPITPDVQRRNLQAVIDFSHTLLTGALLTQNRDAIAFAYSLLTNSPLFSAYFPPDSPQRALLVSGAYSLDDIVRAKALQIQLMLPQIAHQTGTLERYYQYMRDAHRGVITTQVIGLLGSQHPERTADLEAYTGPSGSYNEVFFQQEHYPVSYYLDHGSSLDQQVCGNNLDTLYLFSQYMNKNRAQDTSPHVPITLPNGIFRHIAQPPPADNSSIAVDVLSTAWQSSLGETTVSNPHAIQDVLTLLPDALCSEVSLRQDMVNILDQKALPIRLRIGAHDILLRITSDNRILYQSGLFIELPDGVRQKWTRKIWNSLRVPLYSYIKKQSAMITPETSAFIRRLLTPEFTVDAILDIQNDLNTVKTRLQSPTKGILMGGMTVKFTKGQLPFETRIDSVHYDRTGSQATISLGKTKLYAQIAITEKPPFVESINGIPFDRSDPSSIWLEYLILSPLAQLACLCPNPQQPEQQTEDCVILASIPEETPLPEAVRMTRKVLRQHVGHLILLPRRDDGSPKRYTERQRARVLAISYPLPGLPQLDLEAYNRERREDEGDQYWDYAIYQQSSYDAHQPAVTVKTPYAFSAVDRYWKNPPLP
ncbi:MAG: hypothetical protein WC489_03540 [Patescibacteria group bacterium]